MVRFLDFVVRQNFLVSDEKGVLPNRLLGRNIESRDVLGTKDARLVVRHEITGVSSSVQ
jgi:hypothetical protein